MSSHCQPLPQPLAEEMLQIVARAICDRPGDSSTQRDSRTRQMVHSVLGFQPRDGLEYMLSTIAFGHFQLILDSMRDVFLGQTDAMKARTKTTIVALDRAMLEMVKELRFSGRRPMARSAEEAPREETLQMPTAPGDVPVEAPTDASVAVAAEPVIVATPILASGQASGTPSASRPAKIAPGPARSAPPVSREATAAPADARRADLQTGDDVSAGARAAASALLRDTANAISHSASTSPNESDEVMMRNRMAAFEAAFAATIDTLAESKAFENAREGAKAATGD